MSLVVDTIEDKASDVNDWLKDFVKKITTKEKGAEMQLAEGIGALAPGYLVGQKLIPLYTKSVLPSMFTDIVPRPTPEMASKIKESEKFIDFLKSEGYTLSPNELIRDNAFFSPAIKSTDNIKGKIGWGIRQMPNAPVLAHEYGHAKNNELYRKLLGGRIGANIFTIGGITAPANIVSPILGAVSTGATVFGNDDLAMSTGLAGLGVSAPLVLEETLASARGAHALNKLGMGGKFKAFLGVPSYAMRATIPALPIFGKKLVEDIVENSKK